MGEKIGLFRWAAPSSFILLCMVGVTSGRWLNVPLVDKTGLEHHRQRRSDNNPFTEDVKQQIVDTHNNLRQQEGASNMALVTWDEDLAAAAGSCDTGNSSHGSIVLTAQPNDLPTELNDEFAHKKDAYNHSSVSCTLDSCDLYLQIVWASVTKMGCNIRTCDGASETIVCLYDASSNNENAPFTFGDACSACPQTLSECTDDGLCKAMDEVTTESQETATTVGPDTTTEETGETTEPQNDPNETTAEPPVQVETTPEAANPNETAEPSVPAQTTPEPANPNETTEPPVPAETSPEPANPNETTEPPVPAETTPKPANPNETTQPPVPPETTPEPANPNETTQPPVPPETTPEPGNESETTESPVQPTSEHANPSTESPGESTVQAENTTIDGSENTTESPPDTTKDSTENSSEGNDSTVPESDPTTTTANEPEVSTQPETQAPIDAPDAGVHMLLSSPTVVYRNRQRVESTIKEEVTEGLNNHCCKNPATCCHVIGENTDVADCASHPYISERGIRFGQGYPKNMTRGSNKMVIYQLVAVAMVNNDLCELVKPTQGSRKKRALSENEKLVPRDVLQAAMQASKANVSKRLENLGIEVTVMVNVPKEKAENIGPLPVWAWALVAVAALTVLCLFIIVGVVCSKKMSKQDLNDWASSESESQFNSKTRLTQHQNRKIPNRFSDTSSNSEGLGGGGAVRYSGHSPWKQKYSNRDDMYASQSLGNPIRGYPTDAGRNPYLSRAQDRHEPRYPDDRRQGYSSRGNDSYLGRSFGVGMGIFPSQR